MKDEKELRNAEKLTAIKHILFKRIEEISMGSKPGPVYENGECKDAPIKFWNYLQIYQKELIELYLKATELENKSNSHVVI